MKERIAITLDDDTEALLEITIREAPLPALLENPQERVPTARELDRISQELSRRRYRFA